MCHGCDSFTHNRSACLKSHKSPFYCKICKPPREDLVEEEIPQASNQSIINLESSFKCNVCSLVTKTKWSMKRHIERKHPKIDQELISIEQPEIPNIEKDNHTKNQKDTRLVNILQKVGLSHYYKSFETNKIDLNMLIELTDEEMLDMFKNLGIMAWGERHILKKSIKDIKSSTESVNLGQASNISETVNVTVMEELNNMESLTNTINESVPSICKNSQFNFQSENINNFNESLPNIDITTELDSQHENENDHEIETSLFSSKFITKPRIVQNLTNIDFDNDSDDDPEWSPGIIDMDLIQNENDFYKCNECHLIALCEDSLRKHKEKEHNKQNIGMTEFEFILDHRRINSTEISAQAVEQTGYSDDIGDQIELEINPNRYCNICKKTFAKECNLRRHMENVHNQISVGRKRKNTDFTSLPSQPEWKCARNENFQCNLCGKNCRDMYNLKRHMSIHK